jgi:predicted acetyltransferase
MLYTGVHPFYGALGWGKTTQPMYYVPPSAVPQFGRGKYRITQIPVAETPPEFARIYDHACGQHPISLLRTPWYWKSWPRWAQDNVWFGLLDNVWNAAWEDDRIVAYGGMQRSILEREAIGIVEACALPNREDALWDLLDVLVARCRKARARSIELNLPCDHPFTTRLAPLGERRADHSAMVRVVDVPRLLGALRPELEARSAHLPGPMRVRLDSPVGSATLSADRGAVTLDESSEAARAELTPAGLGSLLLGFRSAGELAEAGEIQAATPIVEQLDLLFPYLHSHYWQIDHF